jgi:hypothetical protein
MNKTKTQDTASDHLALLAENMVKKVEQIPPALPKIQTRP